jgi:hypothetical protein
VRVAVGGVRVSDAQLGMSGGDVAVADAGIEVADGGCGASGCGS